MTPKRFNWIMNYQFDIYYRDEPSWQKDFEKFKLALIEFDKCPITIIPSNYGFQNISFNK